MFDFAQLKIRKLEDNSGKEEATMLVTATVSEVLRTNPETISVFYRHRMQCVGCPFSVFHSIQTACIEHEVETEKFIVELERAIEYFSQKITPRLY